MKDLGITKGIIAHVVNYAGYNDIQSTKYYGGQNLLDESSFHEASKNAEVMVDGFNTAQKCGLLPSELLQQRDELREALEELLNQFKMVCPLYTNDRRKIKKAEKALKNVKETL